MYIKEGGLFYIALLIAVTMHEFGHAYAADKLGDPLPRLEGRVTLNPIAHMDFLGTFLLPVIMIALSFSGGGLILFGWGKPVRVSLPNPKTRARDDMLSTAAGPAANLVLALIFALIAGVLASFGFSSAAYFCATAILVNCMLFIINMLPIPPLDGSHFLKHLTGMSEVTYARLAQWGIVIFLVLINISAFSSILDFLIKALASVFLRVSNLIVSFLA